MKHKKYKSIDGIWNIKAIEYLRFKGFDHPSIEWCVTEKVHGSNLAVYTDGEEVKIAKRGSFLKPGENFFNCKLIEDELIYKVKEIFDDFKYLDEKVEEVVLYGEICGAGYDHPDVQNFSDIKQIQKGVQYSPYVEFYCFDIMVNGEFQDMGLVEEVCEFYSILYAKILFRGTFDECSQYPNKFQTNIPKWLGLPEINDNICEGVVLKPVISMYYDSEERVILKSKNERFLEKSREPKVEVKRIKELSEFGKETLKLISMYITENRLRAVISKIGSFTKKDFRMLFDAFKKDVYEDFNKEYDNLSKMEKPEKKKLDQILGRLCSELIRPIFLAEAE